jgi:hypothetical protein
MSKSDHRLATAGLESSRSPRWLFAAGVLALSLGGCATPPKAVAEGGTPWFRAQTAHLSVTTNLGREEASELARDLEIWRLAISMAAFRGASAPSDDLHVVVLRNRELQTFDPQFDGVFSDVAYVGPVLVIGASQAFDRDRIMKHELAHAVIYENVPGAPQWLNEGLAKYLETTQVDERKGLVEWGALPPIFSNEYRPNLKTSAQVLDPHPWPASAAGVLTYSAGMMVHMLARLHPRDLQCLFEQPRRR